MKIKACGILRLKKHSEPKCRRWLDTVIKCQNLAQFKTQSCSGFPSKLKNHEKASQRSAQEVNTFINEKCNSRTLNRKYIFNYNGIYYTGVTVKGEKVEEAEYVPYLFLSVLSDLYIDSE